MTEPKSHLRTVQRRKILEALDIPIEAAQNNWTKPRLRINSTPALEARLHNFAMRYARFMLLSRLATDPEVSRAHHLAANRALPSFSNFLTELRHLWDEPDLSPASLAAAWEDTLPQTYMDYLTLHANNLR